jgi:hypothetical protein
VNRIFGCWAAVAVAGLLVVSLSAEAQADNPLANVSGGGTAAFDEGEENFGFTTQFSVGAIVRDEPVDNQCDEDLDGLGVGDFTVTDGDDFMAATGEFNCSLDIEGEDGGFVMIVGHVSQGRVNDDGSVTLCGLADIPIDTFSGESFVDCPFAVTFRADGSGFTYYDIITGPAGDAETVEKGHINLH